MLALEDRRRDDGLAIEKRERRDGGFGMEMMERRGGGFAVEKIRRGRGETMVLEWSGEERRWFCNGEEGEERAAAI